MLKLNAKFTVFIHAVHWYYSKTIRIEKCKNVQVKLCNYVGGKLRESSFVLVCEQSLYPLYTGSSRKHETRRFILYFLCHYKKLS